MRFLANENIPIVTVNKLRSAGHDVSAVIELMPGATDNRVLELAHLESRVILTFDRDYGELIYKYKMPKPEGVLYLRFVPLTPEEPAEYILRLLANEMIALENKFTVARRDRLRQRPLPKPDTPK